MLSWSFSNSTEYQSNRSSGLAMWHERKSNFDHSFSIHLARILNRSFNLPSKDELDIRWHQILSSFIIIRYDTRNQETSSLPISSYVSILHVRGPVEVSSCVHCNLLTSRICNNSASQTVWLGWLVTCRTRAVYMDVFCERVPQTTLHLTIWYLDYFVEYQFRKDVILYTSWVKYQICAISKAVSHR